MIDLQELQILSQLSENMQVAYEHLTKSYEKNDAELFNKSKRELLDTKIKIANLLEKSKK